MVWVVALSYVNVITHAPTPAHQMSGIQSLVEIGTARAARTQSVLYLRHPKTRLALQRFRGEPAISRFD